jgi:hypothetical protein
MRLIAAVCFLAVYAFACYYPSLTCGLTSDDYGYFAYLLETLKTQPLHLLQNCVGPLLETHLRELHYRPLLLLGPYLFDCLVWNTNAIGYHLTNIITHCLSTVLVFFMVAPVVAICFLILTHPELRVLHGCWSK